MNDTFSRPELGVSTVAETVTPADSNLSDPYRRLYVGTGGNLNVRSQNGADVIHYNVLSGTFVDLSVIRVNSTNTTASNSVGYK